MKTRTPTTRTLGGGLVLGVALFTACAEEPVVETVLRPVRYEVVRSSEAARARAFAGVARAGPRNAGSDALAEGGSDNRKAEPEGGSGTGP